MTTIISFFNHKGGVSKTTNVFHFSWMLADSGYTVLMVDADPQCNLTGLVLSEASFEEFERHYIDNPTQNIKAGLKPVYDGELRPIEGVTPVEVPGRDGLYLLPGHLELSEYDITLTLAHELSGSVHALKNVPGASYELLRLTGQLVSADYIIVDLNPSLSSINQNMFLSSDGFVIPNSPDYFSQMAIRSLSRVLPLWAEWLDRAIAHPALQEATYKIPSTKPIYLGSVVQNFRLREGAPTKGFAAQITSLLKAIDGDLLPKLRQNDMAHAPEKYEDVLGPDAQGACIAKIPDFNTLVTESHRGSTPVFALTSEQMKSMGAVRQQYEDKMQDFRDLYEQAVKRMLTLLAK
jgi:cellulose biosynthesis protein BcsQ